jgi:8-amino-7-oxononanoate synthase
MQDHAVSQIMESPPGAETVIDGRRYLYFGGTSYLGLASRPEVIEAACDAVRRYGVHSATSRAGFGTNPPTLAVEHLAAEFFGTEEAFYFVSGYVGNHILVQALAERFDAALLDESAHFCLCEAAQLAGKPITRFRHRDPEDLQGQLRKLAAAGQRPLVMTDGVFSMTGAVAPIEQYLRLLGQCGTATLIIDDAHGLGTLGEHGRGSLEHFGIWDSRANAELTTDGVGLYVCGTLSKALGGYGGILSGSRALVQRARSASHYYAGASAPPSPAAGATAQALEIVRREPQLRERLRENAAWLRAGLRGLGLAIDEWPTPVIGLAVGNAENMRRIHRELRSAGILVPYFAAYSGAGPAGRLRIAVFATHTADMLAHLLSELRRIL